MRNTNLNTNEMRILKAAAFFLGASALEHFPLPLRDNGANAAETFDPAAQANADAQCHYPQAKPVTVKKAVAVESGVGDMGNGKNRNVVYFTNW